MFGILYFVITVDGERWNLMVNQGLGGYGGNPSALGAQTGSGARGSVAAVFGMLAFSFVFSVLGGITGTFLFSAAGVSLPFFLILFVMQIGLLFALKPIAARSAPLGLIALYGFTFLSGMSIAPIILSYIAAGLLSVVAQALVLTAILTFGLTAFSLVTDVSLARFTTWMFVGLIGLIVGSIVGIFFQSTLLQIILGTGGAILFSLYLVHDVQKVKQQSGDFSNAVLLTASIYLDIINIFLSLLRLLGALSGNRR